MLAQRRSLRFFENQEIRIMATKKHLFPFGSFSIKNGAEIRFWEDRWLGTTTLREQYPALYSIVRYKGDSLQKVMESSPPSMAFRRDLIGPRLAAWNELRVSFNSASAGLMNFVGASPGMVYSR
jgi:hypothetical protein